MQIEMVPIDSIREYEHNPREISEVAVAAVARSIDEFGFKVPIIVDAENTIIAGHTRLRAARTLGLPTVPVIRADDLTPEQVKAFRLADNQLATLTTWNLELLPLELAELQTMDIDLKSLGFDEDELAKLLGTNVKDGRSNPDEIPEPPDDPITQPGDVWLLGDHRLLCGDAGNSEDVDRLLDGAPIHLVNSDPPYGVRVEPRSNNAIAAGLSSFQAADARRGGKLKHHQGLDLARHPGKSKATHAKMRAKDRPLANDFVSDDEFDRLLLAWFGQIARVLLPGRAFYIWGVTSVRAA
jgi:ParB-like chromosome segregation protein Spo0J